MQFHPQAFRARIKVYALYLHGTTWLGFRVWVLTSKIQSQGAPQDSEAYALYPKFKILRTPVRSGQGLPTSGLKVEVLERDRSRLTGINKGIHVGPDYAIFRCPSRRVCSNCSESCVRESSLPVWHFWHPWAHTSWILRNLQRFQA